MRGRSKHGPNTVRLPHSAEDQDYAPLLCQKFMDDAVTIRDRLKRIARRTIKLASASKYVLHAKQTQVSGSSVPDLTAKTTKRFLRPLNTLVHSANGTSVGLAPGFLRYSVWELQ